MAERSAPPSNTRQRGYDRDGERAVCDYRTGHSARTSATPTQPLEAHQLRKPVRHPDTLSASNSADIIGSILREPWSPSLTSNDLPSDLRAESRLLQQNSSTWGHYESKARQSAVSHNKRLLSDILESTVRPGPAKRACRAIIDSAVDCNTLASPPLGGPPKETSDPREHRHQRSMFDAATMGDTRASVADTVTTVRMSKGLVPLQRRTSGYSQASTDCDPESSPFGALRDVGALEFLDNDWRPTFAVDLLDHTAKDGDVLRILYTNNALRSSAATLELLQSTEADTLVGADFPSFRAWVFRSQNPPSPSKPPPHVYGGISWTHSTVRDRFRFISGDGMVSPVPRSTKAPNTNGLAQCDGPVTAELPSPGPSENYELPNNLPCNTSKISFDWTRIPLTNRVSEHIRFARSVDWASSPLGPIENWSPDLRVMSNLVMGSPHPAALYWGPRNVVIYNEAYIEIAGRKHPRLMGKPCEHAWTSTWDEVEPVFREAREHGQAIMKYDDHIFVDRQGYLEEVYFTWSIVPVLDEEGKVIGAYNPAFENTRRRIGERRMLTLRRIGEMIAGATDVEGLWSRVLRGLETNCYDIPFALIYSVKDADSGDCLPSPQADGLQRPFCLTLEGSLGFPADHPAVAPYLDLHSSDALAPYLRQALESKDSPAVLSVDAGNLPSPLLHGLEPRGFADPCRTVLILPVHPTPADVGSVVAFAVLGLNPRRPFDDDFRLFIRLLSRQLETSMASLTLLEEEVRRGRDAAIIADRDKQKLNKELLQRTQEAVESEYRFTRMAEFAPVGMFIADPSGFINYCNDMWWEISRHPRSGEGVNTWMSSVADEDRAEVQRVWARLAEEKVAITHEFRFNYTRLNAGQVMETWVLMSAYPEKNEAGDVKSIFGCLTDISPQKQAEYSQKQRREEAVELKRQQENFIDITSHEMRNPLSAILQCADEVSSNIADFRSGKGEYRGDLWALLDCCADAANTISFCASHQKRIVDDILTLSKLDSQLLMVTPVSVQPVAVVEKVLKMFEAELASRDILLEFRVEPAYRDRGIDWVRIDPSRLRQVVINLMTNAIKFTQNREQRVIVVSVSASSSSSSPGGGVEGAVGGDEEGGSDVTYFPSQGQKSFDLLNDEEWGTGEEVNLHFSVQDTGPGLTRDEIKVLFQRFSQASPRTHVQYGGSGLGLFISRILTELQGGQIGVKSKKGAGSTFTFYIKSRKAEAPREGDEEGSNGNGRHEAHPTTENSQTVTVPGTHGHHHQPSTYSPGLPQDSLRTMEILIVEDNIVNQKVLQRQLRSYGCETCVANHGGEALDRLRGTRFWRGGGGGDSNISVILMDLEMPVMDGMTCTKRIRELQRDGTITRHIPIIAVTAYARPEQIEGAKSAGVDDVISKPFRLLELIPKIRELAERYDTVSPRFLAPPKK